MTTIGNLCRIGLCWVAVAFGFGKCVGQVRPEVYPVETVTLGTQQILRGERDGVKTMIAGELRIPAATGRLPAVILVHGSDGLSASIARWADELNGSGVAAFLLDSYSGRGISSTVNDQSKVHGLQLMVDAYKALGMLRQHPRLDPDRIAVMGFSKGGIAALYSSNERFRKVWAPGDGAHFAAHIGLYANCNTRFRDDERVTGAPIRLFHGTADDWVSIGACREYVERLRKSGADVALTEYPGAEHGYDFFFLGSERKGYPQGTTTRNCRLEEGEGGVLFNSKTGDRYDLAHDPCVVRGPHVGYNEAATKATAKAIKEFLSQRWK